MIDKKTIDVAINNSLGINLDNYSVEANQMIDKTLKEFLTILREIPDKTTVKEILDLYE